MALGKSAMTSTALLHATGLTKHFDGLAAVDGVSLSLSLGRIHAVIGPNGAGKSTLTHLLSGDLLATSGRVVVGQVDVTGWPPHRIARQGLGRSYQKTNIFLPYTVWDNVHLAAWACEDRALWRWQVWWRSAADLASARARCSRALELAGLQDKHAWVAGTLSHGEQRQLEIAMTLATEPQVLLLDEPLAGMGVAEAQRMVALLLALKKNHAILLVEHDMDAVFSLADTLTVMVNGQVIASGSPDEIKAHAQVQAAYLGDASP
jgi:branched-chain amino acid transport system ATP-binding protein